MLEIFTPFGSGFQIVHLIVGHSGFHVVYFPFPLLLTLKSCQRVSLPSCPFFTHLMAKFTEVEGLEDALETLSQRVCWKHSQEVWKVGRKDPKVNTLIFNNRLKDLLKWVGGQPGGRNVLVYFLKFMWGLCGFPEWVLSCWKLGVGLGNWGHSMRHFLDDYRHCCPMSWKRWIKVGRFSWYQPLFVRTWTVQGKWANIRKPSWAVCMLTSCHLSLAEFLQKVIADNGIISSLPAAENNNCLVTEVTTITFRCHGLMSGWSTQD